MESDSKKNDSSARRKGRFRKTETPPSANSAEASLMTRKRRQRRPPYQSGDSLGTNVKLGLTIAGMASALLTTVFGLFHVDVFLTAYQLPLTAYSVGNVCFSIINTANDVAGAWLVDHVAMTMKRTDLVGISGCIFAFCFLFPFFRWSAPSSAYLDGTHFVLSLSLYDTMFSFTAILMGSVVTDNHQMTDKARVQFMASGKLVNLFASFAVARLGLHVFDTNNLRRFRIFLLILALSVSLMYIVAQGMISGSSALQSLRWKNFFPARGRQSSRSVEDNMDSDRGSKDKTQSSSRGLEWRKVVDDFWRHRNFRAWIGMEMLLEAQKTFILIFLKTFFDRLVLDRGMDQEEVDWLLSLIRPLMQVAAIGAYLPIQRLGYPRVYTALFVFNFLLSLLLVSVANAKKTNWIIVYLFVYPIVTGAVQAAGFHLAMSDMVMEMKRYHALEGRMDEPSLAGLFMGANALMCKPMESLLPTVAGMVLDRRGKSDQMLFYLLTWPGLLFSLLQLAAWSGYSLTPKKTARMREELKRLHEEEHDAWMGP